MEIRSYDSLEAMQADMARAEDEANAGLHPRQVELRDGDDVDRYWVRPFPEANCLIFGRCWSYTTACEASAKYVPARPKYDFDDREQEIDYQESLAEAVWEIRSVAESRARGYMMGEAYSVIEPRGELGNTHVANAWPISEQAFREAEAHGWQAIQPDPLAAALLPLEVVAERTTPTLVAELAALDEAIRAYRESHR